MDLKIISLVLVATASGASLLGTGLMSGLMGATKIVPQEALNVPTFDYNRAISALLPSEGDPAWPASTERINTLRLEIRVR